jgi:hypothetical protein
MQAQRGAKEAPEVKPTATQVCVTLDAAALADLALIGDRCERRTGCEPSRSQIIRAALRAYAKAVE